jgi:hypothetical protein
MACYWFDFREELLRLGLEYGYGIFWAGELSYGFKGLKEVKDNEFHISLSRLAKHVSASIALDLLQAWKHTISEQFLISVGVFGASPSSP